MALKYYLVRPAGHDEFMRRFNLNTTMYQSFWGFEKAQALPPNIILTGPVSKPASDMLKALEEKDKTLFDWMNAAQADNVPIIYITLGSECVW